MSEAVQCPQCDKRFKLGERPPATFTCTQCGTLMDLTAFGGADRKPKEAAPGTGGPRPTSRGGGRRRRRTASARARRDAGPVGPQAGPPKKDNTGAIVAVSVVVLALLILVIARSSGDDDVAGSGGKKKVEKADAKTLDISTLDVTNEVGLDKEIRPIRKPGDIGKRKKRKPKIGRIQLKVHDWPEEVDADTRRRADEAIQDLYRGGRDGVEAREWLVKAGRPVCGRLISEFKAIEDKHGFKERMGLSLAMTIDNTLRQIDGQMERFWETRQKITAWGAGASPQFVKRTAKRWTWWWESGEWKTDPREPWDAHVDESDETEDGIKPKDEEDEEKKGGFGKRAGSG